MGTVKDVLSCTIQMGHLFLSAFKRVYAIDQSCVSESVVAPKDPAMCEEILSNLHVLSLPGLSEEVFSTYHENRPSQFVITSFSSYLL